MPTELKHEIIDYINQERSMFGTTPELNEIIEEFRLSASVEEIEEFLVHELGI